MQRYEVIIEPAVLCEIDNHFWFIHPSKLVTTHETYRSVVHGSMVEHSQFPNVPNGIEVDIIIKCTELTAEQRQERLKALFGSCKEDADNLDSCLYFDLTPTGVVQLDSTFTGVDFMAQLPPDLAQQVKNFVATGQYQTEEEVMRDALRALTNEQHVLDDIRQGLKDFEAGRGRPLENVDADLRKKYNIPQDA